jgi:hypothetical protein
LLLLLLFLVFSSLFLLLLFFQFGKIYCLFSRGIIIYGRSLGGAWTSATFLHYGPSFPLPVHHPIEGPFQVELLVPRQMVLMTIRGASGPARYNSKKIKNFRDKIYN